MSNRATPTKMPSSEASLVDALTEHIETLWADPEYVLEMRSPGGGRADITVLSKGHVYSVEAKLTNWRRAIGQAVLNRYWSNRCYIALWHTKVGPSVKTEARRHGLGVISVSPSGAKMVVGAQLAQPRAHLKGQVRKAISEARSGEP